MGLDMYLTAENIIYKPFREEDTAPYEKAKAAADLIGMPYSDEGIGTISIACQIGYWRKANAIHKWFVDHVQEGRDECQRSHVSRDDLRELRETCQKVLDTAKVAPGKVHVGTMYSGGAVTEQYEDGQVISNPEELHEILPTASGFFFGSTGYDEYYLEDVKHTIKVVDACLAAPDKISFYYQSSW